MTLTSAPDLSHIPLFSALGQEALHYLQTRLRTAHFAPGDEICHVGQRGGFLAIIIRGRVRLTGTQGSQRLLKAGQTFGDGMLRYGVPSSFTAIALGEVTLWAVTRRDWLAARELAAHAAPAAPIAGGKFAIPKTNRLRPLLVAILFLVTALIVLGPELPLFTRRALVDLALDAGRPDLAAKYLPYVAAWLPGPAQTYDSLGYALYVQNRSAEALVALQQAVSLDEKLASAQNNYGVALLSEGRLDEAAVHLQQAVELDPGNARSYYNLGNAYLAAGDQAAAAQAYQQSFDLDPAQVDARSHWAGIALSQGRLDEARAAWQEVLAFQPANFLALQGLGVITWQQDDPVQALAYLEKANALDPQDATTCFYLGLALESDRRPAQAAGFYRQALSLSSDPALIELAQARLNAIHRQDGVSPSWPLGKGRLKR